MTCKHQHAVWVKRFTEVKVDMGRRFEKRDHHRWCADCREVVELAPHARPEAVN